MTFIGGDLIEIVCNHLGNTYRFYPKANETFNVDFGGRRTNDDASQKTSNDQNIRQINTVRWSVDGPIACDLLTGNEQNALSLMSGSPSEGNWQISHISGAIWKGTGSPVGDIAPDSNASTLTLKIAGAGGLQVL